MNSKELDIIAFRVDGEKLCRACFHQLPPKRIKFLAIPRALQRTSCVKTCFKCNKPIVED